MRIAVFTLLTLLLAGGFAAGQVDSGPVTTDADIIAALNTDLPGMEKVKAALQTGSLSDIEQAYLDYRRTVSPVQWQIMPSQEPAAPVAKDDPAADQIIAHNIPRGDYHYGPPSTFMGTDFKWTYNPVPKNDPSYSDEFTYCVIARTEWWSHLADAYWRTHDERYARCWVDMLQDFARKNPVNADPWAGKPSIWRTLDSATRMRVSWPYAYFHFLNSPSFTPAAQWTYLKLMRDHADRLVEGLKNQSRSGNWVTDECCGLYTIGALFPESRDAPQWRDIAINRLMVEFDRSVAPDGFEVELTPGYHIGALSQFRATYDLAKLNHQPIPASFAGKLLNMYRAPVLVMQQNGEDVCTNDSWLVNAAKIAKQALDIAPDPLLEWAASGGKNGTAPADSTMLPYAGFYAMRSGWNLNDLFLFFRAGPPGTGHQHQDMLEVVLRAWNTNLLIDPGTYSYDQSEWRRYVVNTPAHNTIIVDDKWQQRAPNLPPVTAPMNNPWVTTPLFDYVAGTYDAGYQKNVYAPRQYSPFNWVGPVDRSVTHTRRVLYLRPYYVLVLDTLDGTGRHTFEAHWSIDAPGAKVDPTTKAVSASEPNGVVLCLFPLDLDNLTADVVQGQKSPTFLGWLPVDHQRPIPTARYIKRQQAPATFATLLYPYKGGPVPTATGETITDGAELWSERLSTPYEAMEIAISKGGTATNIEIQSKLLGPLQAQAAGLVIRKPAGGEIIYAGGWGLSSYADSTTAFTLDRPGAVILFSGPAPLIYNADTKPITALFMRPFAGTISLPAESWIGIGNNITVSKGPVIFAPFVQ